MNEKNITLSHLDKVIKHYIKDKGDAEVLSIEREKTDNYTFRLKKGGQESEFNISTKNEYTPIPSFSIDDEIQGYSIKENIVSITKKAISLKNDGMLEDIPDEKLSGTIIYIAEQFESEQIKDQLDDPYKALMVFAERELLKLSANKK